MKGSPYARMLVLGGVVGVLAILTVRSTTRGTIALEPPPAEEWLDDAAAAPEVDENVGWGFQVTMNDRVKYWIDFLQGRNREKTRLWLERSGRYAPMIRERLRARGMPEDLIYLALIESGFSPRAYSRAHAAGIWQFIAETGRRYGLEVSSYVDERRDPLRATDAALDYLQDLYRRFGSWYLAAAAYNTGENRVERILRQRAGGARGDDALFWKISPYLPRETRDYVPLMLAAAHIAKNPEKYGFKNLKYHEPLRYEEVAVPGGTALRSIARAAGVHEGEVKDLNPHLIRGATPPGRTWSVRIPVGRRQIFAQNFGRVVEEVRWAGATHTVRRGETLTHIARRYGTSVQALRAANGWPDPRQIRAGQQLRIPGAGGENAVQVVKTRASAEGGAGWSVYRVRRGDSLWSISRRHGVTVRQLQEWNNLGRRSQIVPGQRLRIRA